MEILIAIVILWLIFAYIGSLKKNSNNFQNTPPGGPPEITPIVQKKIDPNVFRPSAVSLNQQQQIKKTIKFKEKNIGSFQNTEIDIKDLVDALTGASLHFNESLFQCNNCKVFYQAQSFEVIKSANDGRCVSCLQVNIVHVSDRREQRGRNADVNIITLTNYRQFVGHVVTFEGLVLKVLKSRRGTDYAVMFENRSWKDGFKMVAFRGLSDIIGGEKFFNSMVGRQVRVRGLIVNHKIYGHQIIITNRSMILYIQEEIISF